MNELSTKLFELRQERSWSQRDLAEALAVSQSTVSRLEVGQIPVTNLLVLNAVAQLLNCQTRDLKPAPAPPATRPRERAKFKERTTFVAFCPEPACPSNLPVREPLGHEAIERSRRKYPMDDYEDIRFCTLCATAPVKRCPHCFMLLAESGFTFCVRCGFELITEISPTQLSIVSRKLVESVEKERVRQKAKRKEEECGDEDYDEEEYGDDEWDELVEEGDDDVEEDDGESGDDN